MRLTLRTLLAYLDDILEPNDADDIGKRIQESEVATALMHRIRDVMRRLRLEAPSVDETQGGLDSNTVAEYLDHVLPDDRVPDFERICLETDMCLAEVAACHQILALVLGEPAEVDPASREHMYALPQVAAELEAMESQGLEDPLSGDGRSGTEPPIPPRRPRPVVPDYLREPDKRRRSFPWAVTIVLLIGVGVVGWMLADHHGLFGGKDQVAVDGTSPSEPTSNQPPTVDDEKQEPSPEPAAADDQLNQPSENQPPAAQPSINVPSGPISVLPPPRDAGPVEGGPLPPTKVGDEGPTPSGTSTASVPEQPIGPVGPTEPVAPDNAVDILPLTPPPAPVEEPTGDDTTGDDTTGETASANAEVAQTLGRFASDESENQVLLQWNPASQAWDRVPVAGTLVSDRGLLALPAFHPLITLSSGLSIQLRNGTLIDLGMDKEQDVPRIALKYGRMVIRAEGKPDLRLMLQVGDRSGTLVFVDPESRVAVEMIRSPEPGTDPENQPAEPMVNVYALSGHFIWESDNGVTKIKFKTPSRLTLGPTGGGAVEPVEGFPQWYVSGEVSNLDQQAARTLEKAIPVGRPVTLGLKEQLDHRKIEVRRLASRSLGYLGDFGPLVDGLNRAEEKRLWTWANHIAELREALARGPDVASQVRQTMEKSFEADGRKVYRMLWGYSAGQLIDGQDATLVELLGSELLAARVLSFQNLHAITGFGLFYRPNDLPSKRKRAIREWEKRQKDGEIRLRAAARGKKSHPRKVPKRVPPKEGILVPSGPS